MNTETILTAAGVAMILGGIALALVIGPMVSRRAAATGGTPTSSALWYVIGMIDALIGAGLVVWARAT